MEFRRFKEWTSAVAAVVMLLLAIALVIPARIAHSQAKPKSIWTLPRGTSVVGFDWLNQTQIVYLTYDHGTSAVYCFDTSKSVALLLKSPTEQLRRNNVAKCEHGSFSLSPTRSLLFFERRIEAARFLIVLNLFTSSFKQWELPDDLVYVTWLPYDRGIAEFTSNREGHFVLLTDLGEDPRTQKLRVPMRVDNPAMFRPADGRLLVPIATDHLLEINEIDLNSGNSRTSGMSFRIRDGGDLMEPAFSPKAVSLAWLQTSTSFLPRVEMTPVFPFLAVHRHSAWRVWVANIATRTIQRLRPDVPPGTSGLKWTPDATGLCFFDGGSMYLLPVSERK